MPEKSLNSVPRPQRELYDKGMVALQRNNLDYALAIFTQVLTNEPGFFECRQALRAAQSRKSGASNTSFLKRMIGGATSQPGIAKAQIALLKNPLEALAAAEDVLNSEPTSVAAHKIVAQAAQNADLPKTAILSLEILFRQNPKDRDIGIQLGALLAKHNEVAKAEAIYQEMLRLRPADPEIVQALKNVTAQKTMKEQGYGALESGEGSFRDILRDKEGAAMLEQENRAQKAEAGSGLVAEYEARMAREPDNLKIVRNLADLCVQAKNYDRAIELYERIRNSPAGADPSLEKVIADTVVRRFDHAIEQLDTNIPEHAAHKVELLAQKTAWQVEECKSRSERYPTDLLIKFELGQLYLEAGKITEAIQEFQKARNNPSKRLAAMAYLGQCYARRGMNDLAARTLQEALKEKLVFDDEKKELVYQLGCVLDKMGKKDDAIEQFKQIYEIDIGYKDVSARVDAYYGGQGG